MQWNSYRPIHMTAPCQQDNGHLWAERRLNGLCHAEIPGNLNSDHGSDPFGRQAITVSSAHPFPLNH